MARPKKFSNKIRDLDPRSRATLCSLACYYALLDAPVHPDEAHMLTEDQVRLALAGGESCNSEEFVQAAQSIRAALNGVAPTLLVKFAKPGRSSTGIRILTIDAETGDEAWVFVEREDTLKLKAAMDEMEFDLLSA